MHALEVGHPADGRVAVAAGWVGQGLEALIGQRGWLVVGAQAALLLDDLDLAGEFVGRQFQTGQAVGFQLQGHGQAVAGQHLVVSGVVVAGEGIFLGAQLAQDARGFARAKLAAAFEHHVFEGVGQAGLASSFVAGTDLVPELGDYHRRAVVFADDYLQAVGQTKFMSRLGVLGRCCQRQAQAGQEQAEGAAGAYCHGEC